MRPNLLLIAALSLAPIAALNILTGCEEKKPAAAPSTTTKADDHGHDHGAGGGHEDPGHGHGGAVVALGEQTIGSFSAKATCEEGQIVAGKDAAIDVTLTPTGAGGGTAGKVVAVRLWIGTQDAKGSVKAKAELEDPKDPNHWHVHAEVPNPMPADSKLWVEIEDDKGGTAVGSFELKS